MKNFFKYRYFKYNHGCIKWSWFDVSKVILIILSIIVALKLIIGVPLFLLLKILGCILLILAAFILAGGIGAFIIYWLIKLFGWVGAWLNKQEQKYNEN